MSLLLGFVKMDEPVTSEVFRHCRVEQGLDRFETAHGSRSRRPAKWRRGRSYFSRR